MYNYAIFVTSSKEVPKVEHYAIITFGNHGYDGYNNDSPCIEEYRAYLKVDDFKEAILEMERNPWKDYRTLHVKPVNVTLKAEVEIS